MGCWSVMLSYLSVGFLNGSALTRCLRLENSRERRSPVKAISRDTGVKLADSLPLRSDVAPNGVDPQVLELLIGNRWQCWLMPGCFTKGLLWCSPAQVRSFLLLIELDTRATHFNAVSKTVSAGQDTFSGPFLYSG
ncbi:hypothetical protein [Gimesia sp.]|uniref:hypothetical protein n=1 Tax=Gimesia sp. TaxID=2024833 RepID=UPI003A936D80